MRKQSNRDTQCTARKAKNTNPKAWQGIMLLLGCLQAVHNTALIKKQENTQENLHMQFAG
jgi:hypothetical protein